MAPPPVRMSAPSNNPLSRLLKILYHGRIFNTKSYSMMAPPSRPGMYGSQGRGRGAPRPPAPTFAVFKPAPNPSVTEQQPQ